MKYLLPILIVVLLLVSLLLLPIILADGSWQGLTQATCLSDGIGCFCEADGGGVIRQPINTLSSLAFVFTGLLIIFGLSGRWLKILGLGSLITGLGSAYYHMSLSYTGQFFDVTGMYMVGIFILVYALRSMKSWKRFSAWTYVSALSLAGMSLFVYPETRRYMFAAFIIIGVALELIMLRHNQPKVVKLRYLWLGLSVMSAGYLIWILDTFRVVCMPDSLVQGHAVWHVLGAVALWLLYLYYASERPATTQQKD